MQQSRQGDLKIVVIGAGGYVGGELLRYLQTHPHVGEIIACSDSRAGTPVTATHPALTGRLSQDFTATVPAAASHAVVFFATPARVAATAATAHLDAGNLVVDCSPDFRLQDLDTWAKWYGGDHPSPQLVTQAVYGLVEHQRDALTDARLIAAPGCYATILQLALKPIAATTANKLQVVVTAASGTSGAGRQPDRSELLLAQAANNYSAYALNGHRHTPEVTQSCPNVNLTFVPHLLPLPRGMYATLHFSANSVPDIGTSLSKAYADEPFVIPLGADTAPQLSAVTHSNYCVLGWSTSQPLVFAALDNLGKGAAGQAIQAMNVALGLDETAGLNT